MDGLQLLNKYLNMSSNNPEFKRDYKKVVELAGRLRDTGHLTQDEYLKTLNQLSLKAGKAVDEIEKAFKWFMDIVKYGWTKVTFTELQFLNLMEARRVSAEFYQWYNPNNHMFNNPRLLKHINELATETITRYQAQEESVWDSYANLKTHILWSLSRILASREKMQTPLKVLALIHQKEQEILNTESKIGMNNMSSFGSSPEKSEVYDKAKIATELFRLYLTDLTKMRERASEIKEWLRSLKASGEITTTEFNEYKAHTDNYSVYLSMYLEGSPYEPIATYYRESRKGTLELSYMYNVDQMGKALDLARGMYQELPNSFLVQELLISRLAAKLEDYGLVEEARKTLKKEFEFYLDLLQRYGVIAADDYKLYREAGRLKFG